MKKFLCNITKFLILFCFAFVIIVGIRLFFFSTFDWRVSSDKKIAFAGASQITRDIDVSNSKEAINIGKPSERYMFTFMKIKKLVANNPQINQIVLQCAPTDLWQNSDDKYFVENEMSEFVPLYYPMLTNKDIYFWIGHYCDMAKFILQHLFDRDNYVQIAYFKRIGYGNQEGQMLDEVMDKSNVKPNLITGTYGNKVNVYYLRKIIDYCKKQNLKLALIYCPMYKPEYYYDQSYYYTQLESFSDVPFYDYSHWDVPDSCRYDAHHLNRKGAELFTQELKNIFDFK